MWNEKELKDIKEIVNHLDCAIKIALGISLKFDENTDEVIVLSESGKEVRRINVSDDSALGVIQDVINSF